MDKTHKLRLTAWSLTALTVIVAVTAWGQANRWHFSGISTYNLFPVFGLLAFSIMWSHYFMAALRQWFGVEKGALKSYFEITSLIVLGCILLHPGLLIWQLFRDGLGLPPGSYLHNYVAPTLGWAAWLGTLSLGVFLAYEFRRWFDAKPWWRFVQYASDLAMGLIFIHALALGRQLRPGWFRVLWWVYGISLLAVLILMYLGKKTKEE